MRIASAGHVVFAAIMIALGIQGLIRGDFTAVWQPVPKGALLRGMLIYLCALISLGCGIGLLFPRTVIVAARVLLGALVVWFLLWRIRFLFETDIIDSTWSFGETMAMIAGAWVLFAAFATDWDRGHLGFATGGEGLQTARTLYGLALIPFGFAHFVYLKHTSDMVPSWLPWHEGWAYFTGATFIAASLAIISGMFARLAASLSALEMGLFGVLVWGPIVTKGHLSTFQQNEVAITFALMAAGWVVADSYGVLRSSKDGAGDGNRTRDQQLGRSA